jgi:hypothetical protein
MNSAKMAATFDSPVSAGKVGPKAGIKRFFDDGFAVKGD